MDIRKQIGTQIRLAREKLGMTQDELAERLGKTRNAISSYETGTRTIRVTELPELAEALKVPIVYFFGNEYRDEEVQELFSKLSPPFRAGMMHVLRQQIEMQNNLLESLRHAGFEINDEYLAIAANFVENSKDDMDKEMREEFAKIVRERLFGKNSDT
jgi:transcriptional regulator with XRE-family HTH domain